jgi:ABC-type phosphate transport system permease subunit
VFVMREAWPSFAHNGLGWFGPGGSVDKQIQSIFTSGDLRQASDYALHAWPLIWSTILITVSAVVIAFVCALFVAVFIVEFAPEPMKRVLEPVVRLLASVPSVIYGLLGVRTARPALIAGTVLATARGLGEAVMLSMVSGGVGFAPNPADGVIFLFEPSQPLATTILRNTDELSSPPMKHTLYAIAAVLMFSAVMLSLTGWAAKQPMKRYGVVAAG